MFLKQPRQTPPSNPSNLVWISLVLGAILSEFERFRAILEGLLGRPRFWRALGGRGGLDSLPQIPGLAPCRMQGSEYQWNSVAA